MAVPPRDAHGTAYIVYMVCIVYRGYMTDGSTGPASTTSSEDDDGRLNFADKYRPKTFKEVFGQESAVACLSGLIERGHKGRSILLHGSVGSGKTTLARIYARALNCEAVDPKDSPCREPDPKNSLHYECEACRRSRLNPNEGFKEYNVSRYGGEKKAVASFVNVHYGPVPEMRYRILFFDEAHALTKEACDLLLNQVETPEHPVLFFFATTEVEKIHRALRSRLFDLLVRPLPVIRAIEFLRDAAKKEKIAHEPGALELLAGLRNGFPRDLLLGLERVWDRRRSPLTVKQVRDAFDVDQTEVLVDYFEALAEGDIDCDFNRQAKIVFRWREQAADRIRWIQAFLLHVYHNDILGRRLVIDGVIEAIPADVRAGIVQRFCRRLGVSNPIDLAPYWCRLMDFWPVPNTATLETAADETALGLRLTLFHSLVNAASAGGAEDAGAHERWSGPTATTVTSASTVRVAEASLGFGPPPVPRPGARVVADEPGFLTEADVRRIVNAASFLMQEHGVLFDAAFEIRPALLGEPEAKAPVATIAAFRDDLAARARDWGGDLCASITVLERDGSGVVGRIVAHLHAPRLLNPADADGVGRVGTWVRAWRAGAGHLGGGDAVVFALAPEGDRAALRFHWKQTLDLCAGLNEEVEAWNPALGEYQPLLKLLGVKARGARSVLDYPLVDIPAPLSEAKISEDCCDRLEPLSAYDDMAWDEIATGWELEEFYERRAARAERERRLAGVLQRLGADTSEACAEVERIVDTWPSDPRQRRRRWRGWRADRPWP